MKNSKEKKELYKIRNNIKSEFIKYYETSGFSGALAYLNQTFSKHDEPIIQIDILLYKIGLTELAKNMEVQVEFYERISRLLEKNPLLEKYVDENISLIRINAAKFYLDQKKLIEAEKTLEKVNSKFHDNIHYLNLRVTILMGNMDFQNALQIIKIIEDKHPEDNLGIYNRAYVYYNCSMYGKALEAISLIQDPDSKDKRLHVDILLVQNKNDEAIKIIKTIPRAELTAEDYMNFGRIYLNKLDFKLAKLFFHKVIEVPEAILGLAQINFQEDNFAESIRLVKELRSKNFSHKNLDLLQCQLDYLFDDNFEFEKAISDLKIKYNDDITILIFEMDVLIAKKDYSKALKIGKKCLKIDTGSPIVYINLIICNLRLNKLEEAIKYFDQANILGSSHPNLLKLAGVINSSKEQAARLKEIIPDSSNNISESTQSTTINHNNEEIAQGKEEVIPEENDLKKIQGEWATLVKKEKDRTEEERLKQKIIDEKSKENKISKSDFEIVCDKARPWGMNYPSIVDPKLYQLTVKGQNRTEEKEYMWINEDLVYNDPRITKTIMDQFQTIASMGRYAMGNLGDNGVKAGKYLKINDDLRLESRDIIGVNGEILKEFYKVTSHKEVERSGRY